MIIKDSSDDFDLDVYVDTYLDVTLFMRFNIINNEKFPLKAETIFKRIKPKAPTMGCFFCPPPGIDTYRALTYNTGERFLKHYEKIFPK